MAASLWHNGTEGGEISWGIMGGVNEIPANFTYSTLLMFSDGINDVRIKFFKCLWTCFMTLFIVLVLFLVTVADKPCQSASNTCM